MSLFALLREELTRMLRPGQRRSCVVANRFPDAKGLGPGNAAALSRHDGSSASSRRYGVYGRARYGEARYAS